MNPEKIIKLFKIGNIHPTKGCKILDFGCGAGELVSSLRDRGFDCYGCDIGFKEGPNVERLETSGLVQRISTDPYRLPYESNSFDIAFSNQVFEHVMDYDAALEELARVLKPGSLSFHTFPSKWRVFEAHTGTPFGGRFKNRSWIEFWARCGINKRNLDGLPHNKVADLDHEYVTLRTNYLSAPEIKEYFNKYKFSIKYINDKAVALSSNPIVSRIGKHVPGIGLLTRFFVARFIVVRLDK